DRDGLRLPVGRGRPGRPGRAEAPGRCSRPASRGGCVVGLDPELRTNRVRAREPTDTRPVAGQPPEPPPDLLALSAHCPPRRGRLAAPGRLRGLGPLDVLRRARLDGHRDPGGHRALPHAKWPGPFALLSAARRANRKPPRTPSEPLRRAPAQSPRVTGSAAAQAGAAGNRRSADEPGEEETARGRDDPRGLPERTPDDHRRYRAYRLLRAQRILGGAPWCASS